MHFNFHLLLPSNKKRECSRIGGQNNCPNTVSCEFKNARFSCQFEIGNTTKDSIKIWNGYFFKKKIIHGVEYDSVFECTNTSCSFDENLDKRKKFFFNRKYGILKVQLDSNNYLERLK
jgi:inosine/xanthosine triphosphate pyrophosphatase family protein